MKVVVWPTILRDELLARLPGIEGAELIVVDSLAGFEAALPQASVLMLTNGSYSPAVAQLVRQKAPQLRLLQLLTAGYENVQALGVPAGVRVANAGDSWSPAVAEHAMALMLAMVKRIPHAAARQREHLWDKEFGAGMGTLDGATLAIVGFGSIGREVARRARTFGMRVIGVTRSGAADPMADQMHPAHELPRALESADVVLLAVPSTPATRGLIGARELALCRPHAILVNVARGNVVDASALLAALRSGKLGGAALDVTDPEPLKADSPLWDLPNVLITPHVAGSCGAAGRARLADFATANVRAYVRESSTDNCRGIIAL